MARAIFSLVFCLGLPGTAALGSPIAEVLCAPTDQMHRKLVEQFGTERRASGLRSPEEVVEIWTDSQGDWTMVIKYASGTSCIVAMGGYWQEFGDSNPA
ncbi:hypothetical protein [Mameliella sediminis]|uniref:hypothetical protein n=1 Tax=Mameliella sediminis TaxID=2836866 RepID=UPI001C47D7DE|nr:hypothetical protein [Mameliella sediminis]MBY6113333.1 hypothetical protein [Antarctobacter heliothermus]MBY6143319.1 hypothetical protein [Mameliella alba]MBV7394618.1 hypothetical protein [Mameliella sediminis]MBY6164008.1 hypothetical protein [Mameliella alba]MBY6172480.1 hypothetical protein [Mameliella alba]